MKEDPAELRRLLLDGIERVHRQVLRRNCGGETPSSGRLIREGLSIARKCIEEVPLSTPSYLDAVLQALKDARDRQNTCGISLDGWEDEDGYILSGIWDAYREAEKLRRR